MTKKKTKNQKTNHSTITKPKGQGRDVPTTLIGHVMELKSRLFWVAIFFLVSAAAVYPFFTQIVSVLTAPLDGEELHYFSPAGGLGFIIKICMYLGIVGALPAFIYHFYRFIQPAMPEQRARTLIGYTLASVVLAICGILFTYNFILPAAVKFLTSFEIAGVDPMLSVDAYMAFVIAYIVAGAFLFQLPLVMLIINSITPLKPSQLLSYERHIIIGAFIIGAVLSPTPDVVNQALLALPLIVMYQLGFALVVAKNRLRAGKAQVSSVQKLKSTAARQEDDLAALFEPEAELATQPAVKPATAIGAMRSMDMKSRQAAKSVQHSVATSPSTQSAPASVSAQRIQHPANNRGDLIDGTVRHYSRRQVTTLRRPHAQAASQTATTERRQPHARLGGSPRLIDGVVRSPQLARG